MFFHTSMFLFLCLSLPLSLKINKILKKNNCDDNTSTISETSLSILTPALIPTPNGNCDYPILQIWE